MAKRNSPPSPATTSPALETFAALVARHPAPETLTAAASEGNGAAVEAFLAAGSNLEERSAGFASPLQAAVNSGRAEVVELLLAQGAAVDLKPGTLYSPLSAAATWGDTVLFRRLIAIVRDTSAERAALLTLASHGQLEELRLLLDKGAVKDARHAIAAAAKHGHFELVKHLVDRGVEWKEFKALRIPEGARDAGFTDLFNYLSGLPYDETAALAAGRQVRDKTAAALAAQRSTLAAKRRPADPGERKALLSSAHAAVSSGALADAINEPIIPAGTNCNVTPLIAAALVGDLALVQALLAAGAKPAPKLKSGLKARELARGPARAAIIALL